MYLTNNMQTTLRKANLWLKLSTKAVPNPKKKLPSKRYSSALKLHERFLFAIGLCLKVGALCLYPVINEAFSMTS